MTAPLALVREGVGDSPTPTHKAHRQKHRLSQDVPKSYACPMIMILSEAVKTSSNIF